MTQYSPEQLAGLAGENLVASTCLASLRWIYRQQPIADIGIDGEIELLNQQNASTGKILKVQVKSCIHGSPSDVSVTPEHFSYWALLAVPVIICSASPEDGRVIWWPASVGRLARSKYHYDQATSRELDDSSREELEELSGGGAPDVLSGIANIVCGASSQFEAINPVLVTYNEEEEAAKLEGIAAAATSVIKFLSASTLGEHANTQHVSEIEERLIRAQHAIHRSLVRVSKVRADE